MGSSDKEQVKVDDEKHHGNSYQKRKLQCFICINTKSGRRKTSREAESIMGQWRVRKASRELRQATEFEKHYRNICMTTVLH